MRGVERLRRTPAPAPSRPSRALFEAVASWGTPSPVSVLPGRAIRVLSTIPECTVEAYFEEASPSVPKVATGVAPRTAQKVGLRRAHSLSSSVDSSIRAFSCGRTLEFLSSGHCRRGGCRRASATSGAISIRTEPLSQPSGSPCLGEEASQKGSVAALKVPVGPPLEERPHKLTSC
jgi:hypothetical protein